MNPVIDLQVQTHCSDGQLSPTALVRLAKRYGLAALAITDHDTVAGIPEAQEAGRRYGVTIVPGIELYSRYRGIELHVLGYHIRPADKRLRLFLDRVQRQHRAWLAAVIAKLKRRGWEVDTAALGRSRSQLLGFGELVSLLHKKPANRRILRKDLGTPNPDLFHVISRYFTSGGYAYVPQPEKEIPTKHVIQLIRTAGGKAVLAHPGQTLRFEDDPVIAHLKTFGLQGLEAITPHHNWHQVVHYQRLARALRLLITAGSDFHEVLPDKGIPVRTRWDYFQPHQASLPWRRR